MSSAASPVDLFSSEAAEPTDPVMVDAFEVYVHLRNDEGCAGHRVYINELWRRFDALGLADPEFVGRFPFECPSRIWEMYLACAFDDWGWKLAASPTPGHGPDLRILSGDAQSETEAATTRAPAMWVEATCPARGTASNRVELTDMGNGLEGTTGPEDQRTKSLRILQALREKVCQHARWRNARLVGPRDGLLVAISGARWDDLGLASEERMPIVVRCLFGLGREQTSYSFGNETAAPGPWTPGGFIEKYTNEGSVAPIPAAPFLRAEYPEVSAVLFCPSHIKTRPDVVGSDFVLVHNPAARVPWPFGKMPQGREYFLQVGAIDRRSRS